MFGLQNELRLSFCNFMLHLNCEYFFNEMSINLKFCDDTITETVLKGI